MKADNSIGVKREHCNITTRTCWQSKRQNEARSKRNHGEVLKAAKTRSMKKKRRKKETKDTTIFERLDAKKLLHFMKLEGI